MKVHTFSVRRVLVGDVSIVGIVAAVGIISVVSVVIILVLSAFSGFEILHRDAPLGLYFDLDLFSRSLQVMNIRSRLLPSSSHSNDDS